MPSFGSGLAHALTQGLTGYQQGADEQRRQLIILAAQRRQEERQKQQDELAKIGALTNAANAGLSIDSAPVPSAPPMPTQAGTPSPAPDQVVGDGAPDTPPTVAVRDTASVRSVKGVNPVSPEGGAANPQPAEPSQDGTVVGQVGKYTLRIPPGGLQGKAARDDAQKQAQRTTERYNQLVAAQDGITDPKMKRSPAQLRVIAANDALYDKYAGQAMGLATDPLALHKQERLFDVQNPTRDSQGPNWQVVTTKDGSMVQVNPKTGETRPIGLQARDTRGGSATQTIAARQAAAVIPELQSAAAIIDKFSDPSLMSQMVKKAGLFGNYANTPEGRQLNQAITQFVTLSEIAKGNKRPTEALMQRFHDIYAPAPGDDDATRLQKQHARQTLIASVTAVAGQAGQTVPTSPGGADAAANPFAALIPAKKP